MRVSVLRGAGDLVVEDRPAPVPGPHDVLVQVASVGVCGSDVHYFEHGRIGSHVVEAPLVLGHEASGVVVDVGASVTRLAVGQRVSVEPGVRVDAHDAGRTTGLTVRASVRAAGRASRTRSWP